MRFVYLFASLASLGVVSAHFSLDFPYARSSNKSKEAEPPCGGYPLNATRTLFPLSGGFIAVNNSHDNTTWIAAASFDSDPTDLTDFNTTSSGQAYPLLLSSFPVAYRGTFCVQVNVNGLGVPGVANGTLATIMVSNTGHTPLYMCSDVVLVSNYNIPSSVSCNNVTGGSTTSSAAPTSTSSKPGAAAHLAVPNSGIAAIMAFALLLYYL